ncbi:precorrin-3B synthase [Actinoplanes sp. ATCC 53533]|uniref:precorrin-3B synthase n=1 Tax=Actinoplanes sp. ATCC 53533 TaxID=1288362 RepID=UPI001F1F2B81|nr:precorrin-3B synthase [Actinoplanes sp. ATCC 53533]
MPIPSVRADADACPGALRLHAAADGPLARVRVPGGRLTGAQLTVVRELATRWGDGHVELTSRANLQLRALKDAPVEDLAANLRGAGLLPSETHELVRNIVASPLAEGLPVGPLDQALCADPSLAELPGRFLFALDSGAGDVAFGADVAALPLDDEVAIIFAGSDAGLRVAPAEVVPALLAAAHAFLEERAAQQIPAKAHDRPADPPATVQQALHNARHPGRATDATQAALDERPGSAADAGQAAPDGRPGSATDNAQAMPERFSSATGALRAAGDQPLPLPGDRYDAGRRQRVAWRVRELTDGPARVAARTAATLGKALGEPVRRSRPGVREPIGIIEQPDGRVAVGALVPLGRLSDVQLKVLASAKALVFTPWRGVILPGLLPQAAESWVAALAGAGLEVAAGSRWAGVTACAGRPGCAKSLADVRADADAATVKGEGLPVHWVGCARGCGSPAGPHVRVEATGTGYEVRSPHARGVASVGEVGALVGAARKG